MNGTAALDELLNGQTAAERFRAAGLAVASATAEYVRHKPGETTIVAYRFNAVEGDTTWGYAHWCAQPARADQIHDKAMSLRPRPSPIGQGVTRIDRRTVLYGFPNDARLRRLRWYVSARKLKRSLGELPEAESGIKSRTGIEVLRYKPERRVVVAAHIVTGDRQTVPVLVRYSTQRGAARLAAIAGRLRRSGVATPAPIMQGEDDRVGVDRLIPGTQLREAIRAGAADPNALADALARFHSTAPPPTIERRTRHDELMKVRCALIGLKELSPNLTNAADELVALLTSATPTGRPPLRLIHGDLHPKNVLVDDGTTSGTGGEVHFVDLERAAVGSPASDLGCFAGHGIGLGIRRPGWSPGAAEYAEQMIDRYRSNNRVDSGELAWSTAVALVDQAVLVTRHLEHGWQTTSEQLLVAARGRLSATSATTTIGVTR